jgi:beta-N-acetylhexosaminidase
MRGNAWRAVAIVAALAATAAAYFLFVRGEDPAPAPQPAGGTAEVPEGVRYLVDGLTPEQKVDGILLVGFDGTDASAPLLETLRERQVGGVVIRPANWLDASQGTALVDEMHAAAAEGGEVPPLFAAAQEGGEHRALGDMPPDNRALNIGDFGDTELAQDWAFETGEAMRDAGFDMNLAPVADVATLDSPIADRAFSDDPNLSAQMTAAAVRGCNEARVACVAKHFPGLGAASASTDDGPATVSLDEATLTTRDLLPFEAAIAEGVPAVMLSHAFYAAYDPVVPGSLSPEVATGLLRERLGFTGVAITDDLGTGAVRAIGGVRTAGVAAVNAGADMLLVESPADAEGVRDELIAAAESGDVAAERLDQAVGRVLELKRILGLLEE